jgi:hypothetical protein
MTPTPLSATAATAARNSALAFQGSRTYVQTVQTASHRGGSAARIMYNRDLPEALKFQSPSHRGGSAAS